jgi:hypothetical protein
MSAEQKLTAVILEAAMRTWFAGAAESGLALCRRPEAPVTTGPRTSDGIGYCVQIPVWVMYSQSLFPTDPTELLAPAVQVVGMLVVNDCGEVSIDYSERDLASLRHKYLDYIRKS